jgi:general secretion pathway protein L
MIKRIFARWIDGLAAALVQANAVLHPLRRFQLRANSQPWTLYRMQQSGPERVCSLDTHQPEALPPELLSQTRGSAFEILVPDAAVQQHRLDVLPAESLPYVDKVVSHRIESLFPWPTADVLHSTTIESRPDGNLDVIVRATSRSAIAPALAAAEAAGAGEISVANESGYADGKRLTPIVASTGPQKEAQQKYAGMIARYAVIALIVLAATFLGWMTFNGWSLSSSIAELDQAIAERRVILQRSSNASASGENQGLEAKKRLTPLVVLVLDELSSILPDDTYLTELSLEAGHLRISGVSGNPAELVPLLEGSGHFKNASFSAPATRIAGSTTDRFSIDAIVIPPVKR